MSTKGIRYIHDRIGMPGWVIAGAFLGICAGILFGDRCAVFEPVASAYIMLLQSVVYPYIMCTLLHGLGRLTPARAARLFRSGWHFMLLLWGITFAILYILSRGVPPAPPPTILDATVNTHISRGLLDLLIPANLVIDLTSNYVPAVVLFCVLFGIALQRFEGRDELLRILDIVRGASLTIWRWLVKLAPIAVFAMFARTAGTIDVSHLRELLTYLGLYMGGAMLLTFVVLPQIVSALAPPRPAEILRMLKEAMTLAAVTTISAVALPCVLEAVRKIAADAEIDSDDSDEIIQTTLSITYPLAQLGNFFVYLFLVFAAFYFRSPLSATDTVMLPVMTLLSCIGCPTSSVNAVGFLGQWLALPGSLKEFYIETMTVTRYGQVLCSVMGFASATIMITLSYFGKLCFDRKKLIRSTCITLAVVILFAAGMHLVWKETPNRDTRMDFTLAESITRGIQVIQPGSADASVSSTVDSSVELPTLHRIQKTQTLRVGYNPHIIPFCYRNRHGDLVGYDVACAYALARALNARIQFVPFTWEELMDDLLAKRFDIAMSGVYLNEERLRKLATSTVYIQSPLALIVPTHQATDFTDMEIIRTKPDLQVTVFRDPVLEPMVRRLFPGAGVNVCRNYDQIPSLPEIDIALWTLIQAEVWAETHDGYTAVKPRGLSGVEAFCYLMPPDSPELIRFVNHWLELKRTDGFLEEQREYWIEGRIRKDRPSRWCVLGQAERVLRRHHAPDR